MKNVRIDENGELRCWNCGGRSFTEKRTMRSKVIVGVGALLTKKKLKCQICGEYNDAGNAQPFTGPESRKYRKAWEKQQTKASPVVADTTVRLERLAALRAEGVLSDEDFASMKAQLLAE